MCGIAPGWMDDTTSIRGQDGLTTSSPGSILFCCFCLFICVFLATRGFSVAVAARCNLPVRSLGTGSPETENLFPWILLTLQEVPNHSAFPGAADCSDCVLRKRHPFRLDLEGTGSRDGLRSRCLPIFGAEPTLARKTGSPS